MNSGQLGAPTPSAHPALGDPDRLTTPFEDWCEAAGTHPEALGAWERFTQHDRVS